MRYAKPSILARVRQTLDSGKNVSHHTELLLGDSLATLGDFCWQVLLRGRAGRK